MRKFTDEQLTKMRTMVIEDCKDNKELSTTEKKKIEKELDKQKAFIKKYGNEEVFDKYHSYKEAACFNKMNLSNVDFSGMDLRGALFIDTILINTNFSGANLQGATFNFATCTGVNFSGANLEETEFWGAKIDFSLFNNSNIRKASFCSSFISNSLFRNANAEQSVFFAPLIQYCYFNGANLNHADFEGSIIESCDFSDSNIHEAYFVLKEEYDVLINNPSICPKEGAFYGYIKVDYRNLAKQNPCWSYF